MASFYFDKVWSSDIAGYSSDGDPDFIESSRLTVFIGANNSGKSRLVRSIFSCAKETLKVSIPQVSDEIKFLFGNMINSFAEGADNTFFSSKTLLMVWRGEPVPYKEFLELLSGISSFIDHSGNTQSLGGLRSAIDRSRTHREKFHAIHLAREPELSDEGSNFLKGFKRFYIPTLRGMRPFHEKSDYNLDRTMKDYFASGRVEAEQLVTGFDLYELLSRFLLGQPSEREIVREYERLLGEHFFSGQEVTLIPEYGKDTVAVKIGEDEQRPIFELGDGLQQVIIISSAAFLNNEASLYFIEEPELFLHPGLLKKLMRFLLDETPHQYFCATHSNHILDLSETRTDVSINKVLKSNCDVAGTTFKLENMIKDRDILERLGVTPSSVFLANSSIWVEGITDRLYLRKYLEKYIDEDNHSFDEDLRSYLENFHYIFVEYQGAVLTHWDFDDDLDRSSDNEELSAFKLSSDIFLIADGDISNKGDRVDDLKRSLGDNVFILGCKEIENLIPRAVLVETAKRYYKQRRVGKELIDIDAVESVDFDVYSKSNQGIGRFLDRKCCKRPKDGARFFSDKSGTIKDKLKFCRIAMEVMDEIDWSLNDSLNSLCGRVFEFIVKANK